MPPTPRLLSWGGLGSQRLRSLPSRLANSPWLPAVELLVLVTPECVPLVQASSLRCPSLPILRVTPRGYSRTPCPWSRDDPLLSRTRGAGEVCPRVCGCRDGLIPPLKCRHFYTLRSVSLWVHARLREKGYSCLCGVCGQARACWAPTWISRVTPPFLRTRGAHTERPRCALPASRASSPVPGGSKSE